MYTFKVASTVRFFSPELKVILRADAEIAIDSKNISPNWKRWSFASTHSLDLTDLTKTTTWPLTISWMHFPELPNELIPPCLLYITPQKIVQMKSWQVISTWLAGQALLSIQPEPLIHLLRWILKPENAFVSMMQRGEVFSDSMKQKSTLPQVVGRLDGTGNDLSLSLTATMLERLSPPT